MSGIDEQHLIELIEGDMTGLAAESLRAELIRKDAALAMRVAAMQRDRQMLRSLPPVDPPMDFLVELEPMIARPMLMDDVPGTAAPTIITKPGAARRAAHREQRRAQLVPAAMAAGIVLALTAGLWFTLSRMGVFNSDRLVAGNSPVDSTLAVTPAVPNDMLANSAVEPADDATTAAMLASGELHHKLPPLSELAGDSTRNAARVDARAAIDTPGVSLDNPQFVLADFELMIHTIGHDETQNVLARAIEPLEGRAAVVRNLTPDNLMRIEAAWLAGRPEADAAGGPVRAELNSANPPAGIAGDGRSATRSINAEMLRDAADKLIEAGLVAGEPALMPQYSTQIELSEDGAVYTIVLPVREVQVMLARLTAAPGVESAMLIMRDRSKQVADADATRAAQWISDLASVQHAWEQLSREHPEAVVVLPIVVAE